MAGRLNLSATGIQDYWLTEEPDFSYFLMNFKRHTKFSTEAIKNPFDGDCNFDTINECRIPNNKGDLIRSTMLQFTLPQPKASNKTFTVTVNSGYFYIDGIKRNQLTLYEGTTYFFNNTDHATHPFRFSETSDFPPNVNLDISSLDQTYFSGTPVQINASASDLDGYVEIVEFFGDDNLIGSDSSEPFGIVWENISVGEHTIFVNAYNVLCNLPEGRGVRSQACRL